MSTRLMSGLVLLAGLAACVGQSTPSHLCNQTVQDYATFRDNPESATAYAELFSEDGVFTLGPDPVSGRKALAARHQASHQNAVWKHEMNAISITDSDGKFSGNSRVTVTTHAKDTPNTLRTIVADYADEFEIVDGACLIQSRTVKVLTDDTVTTD